MRGILLKKKLCFVDQEKAFESAKEGDRIGDD